MCTVSFIANNGKIYITSNRDEHKSRPKATAPKVAYINNCKLIYPIDTKAGGTWFALKENGSLGVLLNGAFQKHIPMGGYDRSRGHVLLDIISAEIPSQYLEKIALENIEPFTVILFEDSKLCEFRWDGINKHWKELNTSKNYIWSSATLYSKEVMQHRETLFSKFLLQHEKIAVANIIDFHSSNANDRENGFIIDRNNGIKTFSITQAILDNEHIVLDHLDLLGNKRYSIKVASNTLINQIE